MLKIVADQPIVEKHHIRIKKGKDGELTIKRSLIEQGKAVEVVMILKLDERRVGSAYGARTRLSALRGR